MLLTLKLHGSWWWHFHRKTHPFAKAQEQSLAVYAAELYTSTDPVNLAILTVAYARCTSRDHPLYSLVERLIISDPTYCHTLHGLECLGLLAKSYIDEGHPRRGWRLFREGLGAAQLMVSFLSFYIRQLTN